MSIPFIIGHRGACGHAPENTLASIRKAAELGAQWVEFDTMLSRDNQVILFHDDALKRITGRKGLVAETDWRDLQNLDAGSRFSDQFVGEGIPLLKDAMEVLEELGLGAVVEIKPSLGRDAQTARLVAEMVRDQWPDTLPPPLLSSFNVESLQVAQACAPDIRRALNIRDNLMNWQDRLLAFDCAALHCWHELLDETTATAIITAGYDLRCFTINKPKQAEVLSNWGVCSIFTNFPDRF